MLRTRWQWFWLVLTGARLLAWGGGTVAADDKPASPSPTATQNVPRPSDDPPVNVFLTGPADLSALWKSLAKPDFVILRGEEYERLRKAEGGGTRQVAPWAGIVGSVAVRGTVRNDLATLTVEFGIDLATEGPNWVPLRLDGQTLTGAGERQSDLRLQVAEAGDWQVELSGRGRHTVSVGLVVPVRLGPDGKRLELAIPEAASTRFAIEVPQRVTDAHAGPTEPVAHSTRGEAGLTRLAADLSPRQKLLVVWRVEEESGAPLPPLLLVQGEIAVDVESGSFRTRSSWSIRSVRGTARSLQFRIDPEEEVLEVELDGQAPPAGIERAEGATRMTIPLTEPLGPGQERRLQMTTRRSTATNAPVRVTFTGFSLINATEQAGVIGVSQGVNGNLFVSGSAGRGVRRIDPRTELPADLRARPATALAYRFSEQPFDLTLRVEPSPPLVRVEARTTVALEPGSARVDTWLDYEVTRGRLDDLSLAIPPGLEIDSVGPDDIVTSWQSGLVSAVATPASAIAGFRYLTVRVSPRAPDGARFSLHITGRQPIEPGRDSGVAILAPLSVLSGGGRIAVLTDPSLTTDLVESSIVPIGTQPFRAGSQGPASDWPWPTGRAPSPAAALWLHYAGGPTSIPLRVTSHPRSLSHSTAIQARVDRREAEVRQETDLTVRFGSIDHIDVVVPESLEGRWDDESTGVVSRTSLGRSVREGRLYRLKFQGDSIRQSRLRFRYRVPLPGMPGPESPIDLQIPWIRPVCTTEAAPPVRASVTAEAGLLLSSTGSVWVASADTADTTAAGANAVDLAERLSLSAPEPGAGGLPIRVLARALAILPKVVVPRLALQTTLTPEGRLRTTAWFGVETREPALSLALPTGAELEWARVGGVAISQVEQLPQGRGIRVGLPTRAGGGPVRVELEYSVRPARSGIPVAPPRVLDGGVVQQTFWDFRLPWNQALVGVPAGWSDENEWYWAAYVWKRRPWRSPAELVSWATDFTAGPEPGGSALDPLRGEYHGYVFGRPGQPTDLAVTVASRSWLVALCSGGVLAVGGILILRWRPTVKFAWTAALASLLLVGVLLHPSVTILAFQSAEVGFVLTILLAAMHRFVERRRPASGVYVDPSGLDSPGVPGSTFNRVVGVGSDDSTAIRKRPVPISTMDYHPASPPVLLPTPSGEDDPDRTSRTGRVGRTGTTP